MKPLKPGKRGKVEEIQRREKVRELYLKGTSATDIARRLEVSYPTILKDIGYLQTYYTKLALNNPHIAEKQFVRVEKLLDEVDMVKKEFWDTYNEIKTKAEQNKDIPNQPQYFTTRLETLKAIISRIDQEAKLLNLFNPSTLIQANYISIDMFKEVLLIFKNIIMDLIPEDKKGYAIERLKGININAMSGKEIIDAEIVPETKKIEGKNGK